MRFQDLTGRSLAEDTADLMEFQNIRKIFWNQKNSEWTYRFEVGGNMFQLFMMDALATSPTTGEQVGGVDVAFARMRMQRGAIWAHDTDNTGDTGSQARAVFSHVVSGIIDYCKRRDPQFIEFQANVVQGKSKLYATIYNYLAKRAQTFGYVPPQVHDNGSGADHFVLWHETELQGGGDIRENAGPPDGLAKITAEAARRGISMRVRGNRQTIVLDWIGNDGGGDARAFLVTMRSLCAYADEIGAEIVGNVWENDARLRSAYERFGFKLDYEDDEEGDRLKRSPIRENATAGATSAASVATVPGGRRGQVGGLGVGFDPNGDQGIYAGKPKKKKSGDGVIRR